MKKHRIQPKRTPVRLHSAYGLFLPLVLLLLSGFAAAESPSHLQQIRERGVLRIGTPGDYAPYAKLDELTGSYLGADIALGRQIALSLGLRAEIVPTTWATLAEDANADVFDIALGGISVNRERARDFYFSKPYARDHKTPLVRCGEESRFDSVRDINRPDVRLIENPGGTNEEFARRKFPAAQLIVHSDNKGVFDEISASRADVMVTDSIEAQLQQRSGRGLCAVDVGHGWASARKAVFLARDKDLKAAINKAFTASGGARAYLKLQNGWLAYPWSAADTPGVVLARWVDQRLAVVTEVARWKWNRQAAIEDLPREQSLLQSMRERGTAMGLPAGLIDEFYGAQIEAAKQLQRELFDRWTHEKIAQFKGVAELDTALRPQIDGINAQMLQELARLALQKQASTLPVESELTMAALSPRSAQIALMPLTHTR
jgi:chorismate mutase-like protein